LRRRCTLWRLRTRSKSELDGLRELGGCCPARPSPAKLGSRLGWCRAQLGKPLHVSVSSFVGDCANLREQELISGWQQVDRLPPFLNPVATASAS
jgi:hypothetical protein